MTFIEAHLPVKGGWFSIVSYILLYKTDAFVLSYYSVLIEYGVILVTILETTQITNFSFKISRVLKDRIDFEKGVIQFPALAILTISVISVYWIVKLLLQNFSEAVSSESQVLSYLLLASILVMLTISTMGRYY